MWTPRPRALAHQPVCYFVGIEAEPHNGLGERGLGEGQELLEP
jgi:hypothetical protein